MRPKQVALQVTRRMNFAALKTQKTQCSFLMRTTRLGMLTAHTTLAQSHAIWALGSSSSVAFHTLSMVMTNPDIEARHHRCPLE